MHTGHFFIQPLPDSTKFTELYSPWFPREADNAIFAFEEIMLEAGTASFDVTVYHKNTEDEGDGSSAGTGFTAIGSSNVKQLKVTGLKELVRFHYKLSQTANEQSLAVYRMLAPTWYNTEKV